MMSDVHVTLLCRMVLPQLSPGLKLTDLSVADWSSCPELATYYTFSAVTDSDTQAKIIPSLHINPDHRFHIQGITRTANSCIVCVDIPLDAFNPVKKFKNGLLTGFSGKNLKQKLDTFQLTSLRQDLVYASPPSSDVKHGFPSVILQLPDIRFDKINSDLWNSVDAAVKDIKVSHSYRTVVHMFSSR